MIYVPRGDIERQALEGATSLSPRIQVIAAPRGSGKSALLRHLVSELAAGGSLPVLVDIERISSSPADFARYFPAAIAAAVGPVINASPRLEAIRQRLAEESTRRRPDPALLLDEALGFAGAAALEGGPALVLLLDELAEVSWLARHAGLRDALNIVTRRLAPASAFAVIASVSPASRPEALLDMFRREAADAMSVTTLPPMHAGELAVQARSWGCDLRDDHEQTELWMRATGGRPLYTEILARRVAAGGDLSSALAAELTPPTGALYQECRFDYHLLVERSRGHSVVRTIMRLLARQEGINLSGIAQHLRIQLPTALDYLSWLLEVELIRRDGHGYVIVDPLLRLWVRLNGPESVDLPAEVATLLRTPRIAPRPASRPRGRRPVVRALATGSPAAPPPRAHRDLLIEID